MRRMWSSTVLGILLTLLLSGCSTKVYVKQYPIETPGGPYARIRIGVPTAGAGAGTYGASYASSKSASVKTAVVDSANIMAIVQNEVMRSLQGAGHHVVLVTGDADLDLQISFEPPSYTCDLECFLTLGQMPLYKSVGGARLVDGNTGNILSTYELNTEIRAYRGKPPRQIQDWEKFAKKLAEEVRTQIEQLKLAETQDLEDSDGSRRSS